MSLRRKHRLIFAAILLSFLLGMFLFLLAASLITYGVVRRAWVPEPVRIIRQAVIGYPSSLQPEIQPFIQPREEVPLPDSSLMFDTGFRPQPDGFNFANYGSRFPEGDLTIKEAQELFGNLVCVSGSGESCLPSPAAQMWLDTMNDYMADGHCAGFTVASRRFFDDQLAPVLFASAANVTYDINQNIPMMRQIAKDWSMQVTEEVWQARADGTPREVVDALLQRQEPVDLGIFGRTGGGHSLLAYGIEDKGDGIYHILVYDNNWPGQELYVEVDYKANTWRYALGATDPGSLAGVWEGDAHTNTLIFIPFDAYDLRVTCPFCEVQDQTQGARFTFVSLTGDEALLQVTDEQGNRLGHFGDQFVNEVDGARLTRLKDAMYNDREPYLALPQGLPFNVRVVPRPGKKIANSHLRLGGPGFAFAIDGMDLAAGKLGQIKVSPRTQQLIYKANTLTKPTLKLALQKLSISTIATVGNTPLASAAPLNVSLHPQSGELIISGQETVGPKSSGGSAPFTGGSGSTGGDSPSGGPAAGSDTSGEGMTTAPGATPAAGQEAAIPAPPEEAALIGDASSTVNVMVAVVQPNQKPAIFIAPSVPYLPQGSVAFDLAAWDGIGPITIRLDRDGDEVYEQTIQLPNQPLARILSQQLSALDILTSLGELDPYLDDPQIAELLAELANYNRSDPNNTLTTLKLDGDDLGEVLFMLNGLNLSPAELAAYIAGLNLPPDELAHLLFELNLPPDGLANLIEALDLPPEVISAVQAELETLEEVEQALQAWEAANLPLEQLPTFLQQYPGLTIDQLGFFLDELNLEPVEVADILAQLQLPDSQLTTIFYELNLTQAEISQVLTTITQITGLPTTWSPPNALPTPGAGDDPTTTSGTAVAAAPTANPTPATQTTVVPQPSPSPVATLTPPPTVVSPPPPPPDNSDDDDDDSGGSKDNDPPPNNAPVAQNDTVITDLGTAVTVNVLANDSDPDGNPLTLATVDQAGNGALAVSGGQVTYTPDPGFIGTDSFNYTISDGRLTASASVILDVNGPPTLAGDSATIPEDVATLIHVLNNDTDPEGTALTLTGVGPASHGSPSLSGAAVLYTPNSNFRGVDTFNYTVSDGRLSRNAIVTVTVNGAPLPGADTASTNEETAVQIPVLANDSDPENDPISLVSANPAGSGSVVIVGSNIEYTPNLDFSGTDSFSYSISDGVTSSISGQITVTVINTNDPPVGVNDNAATNEDTQTTIDALDNDLDPDNDPLTLIAVTPAGNGTAIISGNAINYMPNSNYFGPDSFTYTLSDGAVSSTATVSVVVNPVNDDPPLAVNDSATTASGAPVDISVLTNDSDPDNDPLEIIDVGPAANGLTTFLAGGSTVQYVSTVGFTGVDSFTYTISDGSQTATATVTVTVTP